MPRTAQNKFNSRQGSKDMPEFRSIGNGEIEHNGLRLPDDMSNELASLNVYIDRQTTQVSFE